jgi:hypothetical protein
MRKSRKEKKRKRPRKARRWLQQRQGSVCPKPIIPFFLVHEYLGLEAARLGWSIGSCISFLQGSHVQRKFRKQTTLRSESSTLKGLLYAPIQRKQYHKRTTLRRLKILLQSIVARKVRTIALEQSTKKAVMRHAINAIWHGHIEKSRCKAFVARKARTIALERSVRKLSEDKRQSTFIHKLDILWWFHTRAVLHSLANARKCQLEDFCEKERYESCSVQRMFTADAFRKRRKRENSMVVMLLPGSNEHLALRNPRVLFQKHGGACTMY